MVDLEQLIREKQDLLRGRPEDWIDHFGAWRRRQDWVSIGIVAAAAVSELLLFASFFVVQR